MDRRTLMTSSIAAGGAVAILPHQVAQAAPGSGKVVNASSFGFDPTDATAALQAALDSDADTIIIDRQKSDWITGPLFVRRSNVTILLRPGVTLRAKSGAYPSGGDCLITITEVANTAIIGYEATLRMNKSEYTSGEWRHAINVRGSDGVLVEGLTVTESGGDGLYVGISLDPEGIQWSRDVTVRNCWFDNHRRNNVSVISVDGFLMEGCSLTRARGTSPMAGLDFEPNAAHEILKNCVVRECDFDDNEVASVYVVVHYLLPEGEPIDITFERCFFGNANSGVGNFRVVCSAATGGPSGSLKVKNCFGHKEKRPQSVFSVSGKKPDSFTLSIEDSAWVDWDAVSDSYLPISVLANSSFGTAPSYGGLSITGTSLLTNTTGAAFATKPTFEGSTGGLANLSGNLVISNPNGVNTSYGAAPSNITITTPSGEAHLGTAIDISAPKRVGIGSPITITVSRTNADPWPVGVRCRFGGTAVERVNYVGSSRSVVIPAGQTSATLTLATRTSSKGAYATDLTVTAAATPGITPRRSARTTIGPGAGPR